MTRKHHVDALATMLERRLDTHVPRARRLLEVDLARVEDQVRTAEVDPEWRGVLRIRCVVESARDAHLASLDADDGLAALLVGWEEVVIALRRRRREQAASRRRRCPRCEATMEVRDTLQVRRRTRTTAETYRCPRCGLTRGPRPAAR